jgi:hypothetical protein
MFFNLDDSGSQIPSSEFSPSESSPVRQMGIRIGGSVRKHRQITEFSSVKGGIEAEEPELQQMDDFSRPMKWQRSFRKHILKEDETSNVPVRASDANESLVIKKTNKMLRGRVARKRGNLEQKEGLDYIT